MPGRKAGEEQRREEILNAAFRVATAHGLAGLTVRRVAAQAQVSHGLVHFHYKSKDELLVALLDHVLTTATLSVRPSTRTRAEPLDRMIELVQQEMGRLTSDRRRIHLFFDFWLAGTRHARLRARMRAELERYRAAFRPLAEEVLRAEPHRFEDVSAEALASLAVALVKGCAVQSVIEPGFDVAGATAAVRGVLCQLESRSAA